MIKYLTIIFLTLFSSLSLATADEKLLEDALVALFFEPTAIIITNAKEQSLPSPRLSLLFQELFETGYNIGFAGTCHKLDESQERCKVDMIVNSKDPYAWRIEFDMDRTTKFLKPINKLVQVYYIPSY